MLVDGGLAAVLAFLGIASGVAMVIQPGSSAALSRPAGIPLAVIVIPLALALAVPVIFRRSHPVAAFVAAVVIGGIQVLLNIRPNATDLVIVILLYTLAAYTSRRISVTGRPGWRRSATPRRRSPPRRNGPGSPVSSTTWSPTTSA